MSYVSYTKNDSNNTVKSLKHFLALYIYIHIYIYILLLLLYIYIYIFHIKIYLNIYQLNIIISKSK